MYYACDQKGNRIYIDDAVRKEKYYCPVCNSQMIIKRGRIKCHHFAHESNRICDLWYRGNGKSKWHRSMQSLFPSENQEVAVWDEKHFIFHIADIAKSSKDGSKKTVYEFQHSSISTDEFIERSRYFMNLGYTLIWIFDYCTIYPPKTIFCIEDSSYMDCDNNLHKYAWPGKDRIKMFDTNEIKLFLSEMGCNESGNLYIYFYVSTGMGRKTSITYREVDEYTKWEYVNPFMREEKYLKVHFSASDNLSIFYATTYAKEQFESFLVL